MEIIFNKNYFQIYKVVNSIKCRGKVFFDGSRSLYSEKLHRSEKNRNVSFAGKNRSAWNDK